MMAGEPSIEEIQELLDPKTLSLPASMPVRRIEAAEYVDWEGEDAIRVTVVLEDSVDVGDDSVTGQDVLDLQEAIRSKLREHKIAEFAYISITSERELEEDVDLPE